MNVITADEMRLFCGFGSLSAAFLFFAAVFVYLLRGRGKTASFLMPSEKPFFAPWEWTDTVVIGFLFFFLPGTFFSLYRLVSAEERPAFLTLHQEEIAPEILRYLETEDRIKTLPGDERTAAREEHLQAAESGSESLKAFAAGHPLTRLMILTRPAGTFVFTAIMAFVVGVVLAPIGEEFIFRRLLQGTAAKMMPGSRHIKQAVSILFPAVIFAAIHYRSDEPFGLSNAESLLAGITLVTPLALVTAIAFGIVWLVKVAGADWRALGFCPRTFIPDCVRGVSLFLLFLPTMAGLQAGLKILLPHTVTDPVPIFFLACYLGLVTAKTGRLTPAVAMHASLNLFSFLSLLSMTH